MTIDSKSLAVLLLLSCATSARAEEAASAAGESNEALAEAAQNPVADMVSIPVQENLGLGYGPGKEAQRVLNIQPVIPVTVSPGWNVITRTIIPIVTQPSFTGGSATTGLGNITATAFLSPRSPGALIWGVGPVLSLPTATSPLVGSQSTWGLGPSAVALAMPGHWTLGVLANQIWSVAGASQSTFLLQYFVNYNLPHSWYLTSSPILTANWDAASSQRWVVPFGGGFGKVFRIGKLPFNANLTAYVNAVKPDVGPDWTLRAQIALLLPKSIF